MTYGGVLPLLFSLSCFLVCFVGDFIRLIILSELQTSILNNAKMYNTRRKHDLHGSGGEGEFN